MRVICAATLALAAPFAVAPAAGAQPVALRTLTTPQTVLAEPFSELASIREMRDGRLIAIDGREFSVQLVDMRAGTVKRIGRIGDGPGEYRMPAKVFALGGDTSAVVDRAHPQGLLVLLPGGRTSSRMLSAMFAGRARAGRLSPFSFNGSGNSDAKGRLYFEIYGARDADSVSIARWDRSTGRIDTAARTRRQIVRRGIVVRRHRPRWEARVSRHPANEDPVRGLRGALTISCPH